MDVLEKKELEVIATKIRLGVIECVYNAQSGHPGGSLSIAELLAYLYYKKMNVDPKTPKMEDRDRFVLSKGHCSPALYAVLAEKGFFDKGELKYFRKLGSMLQGHPDKKSIPGIDMSSGSLGQGISAACGMAIAAKMAEKNYKVYCVMGDGEIQEGQVWEAAMFAGNKKLNNLCAFIDFNNLQITGKVTDIMSPCPIDEKFKAFGWTPVVIDGHDFDQIEKALKIFDTATTPVVVILNTTKGKGVSFMEDNFIWHGIAPNKEQYEQANKELNEELNSLLG